MPTIEIVCLGQKKPLNCSSFPFAVRAENRVISHRGLFYDELKQFSGCIYHLGNPDFRPPSRVGFFAGRLMNWYSDGNALRFKPRFQAGVQNLLQKLLAASPCNRLIFLSDYQFGGEKEWHSTPLNLRLFWHKHARQEIDLNSLYFLTASQSHRTLKIHPRRHFGQQKRFS